MNLDNLFPIVWLGVEGLCSLFILITAILCLSKKKSGIPLAAYGLCVALLLGLGYIAPNESPAPISMGTPKRFVQPEPVQKQEDTDQEANEPGDDAQPEKFAELEPEETAKPISGTSESEPAVSTKERTPTKSQTKPTTTAPPASQPSSVPTPSIAPAPQNLPESNLSDSGPTLADDTYIAPMSNPTLSGEPEPALAPGPTLAENGNNNQLGGNSHNPYYHDFSNGRLLASKESDKYHCKNCMAAQNILFENELWFTSVAEAEAQGYSPCGICYR